MDAHGGAEVASVLAFVVVCPLRQGLHAYSCPSPPKRVRLRTPAASHEGRPRFMRTSLYCVIPSVLMLFLRLSTLDKSNETTVKLRHKPQALSYATICAATRKTRTKRHAVVLTGRKKELTRHRVPGARARTLIGMRCLYRGSSTSRPPAPRPVSADVRAKLKRLRFSR